MNEISRFRATRRGARQQGAGFRAVIGLGPLNERREKPGQAIDCSWPHNPHQMHTAPAVIFFGGDLLSWHEYNGGFKFLTTPCGSSLLLQRAILDRTELESPQ